MESVEPLAHGAVRTRIALSLVEYDHDAAVFGARHADWHPESVDRIDVV